MRAISGTVGKKWARVVQAVLAVLLFAMIGAVPGVSAQAGAARLSLESIEREVPQGLIAEIDLTLPGGSYPGCISRLDEPELKYMPGDLELMDVAMITTCGWKSGEPVRITIRDPRGSLVTEEVQPTPARFAKDVYEVNFFYQPPVSAPEGIYRFTFEGEGLTGPGTVKAKVTFKHPAQARIFVLGAHALEPVFGARGGQHELLLYGFRPEEPVRLMAYRVDGTRVRFFGWQDYITDRRGQLTIAVDLEPEIGAEDEMVYYAYARETHFVAQERFGPDGRSISDPFQMDLYCPGAQAPRITSRYEARAAESAGALKIVQVPGFGSRVTIEAPRDVNVYVFGQPRCIDHAFWWQVWLRDPVRFGWAAESFQGDYLLEPMEEIAEP